MKKDTNWSITIIWWSDGFGKWLANYIKSTFKSKVEITITWRDLKKLQKVSQEINCRYDIDNINAVKNADITIFAVPIWFTVETIKKVAPFIKEWAMVLDVTSIKYSPSKALRKYCKKWVFILPTHPMFWPYISNIAWQIFVLCPEKNEKYDERYIFLKKFLEENDAKVIEETPKNHDKMMAIVQWLTHFDMFVFWETVRRLKLDIKKSMDFVSPIYKIMISSVARYLNQNPKLYSDIQIHNTEVLKVHKTFMKTTNDFNKIVKEKNEKRFIKTVEKTQKYFWEETIEWQEYTDKIIYMIWEQTKKAHSKVWKQIKIENIYSKEKINWKLESFIENNLKIDWINYDLNKWNIN